MNVDSTYEQEQQELYEKVISLSGIEGAFEFDGYSIKWHRNSEIYLDISTDIVKGCKEKGHRELTHFHPDNTEEIIDIINDVGKKGNIFAYCPSGLAFCGSAEEYKSKKRFRFALGHKYIFGKL